jgi:superfamily II RNA helicase
MSSPYLVIANPATEPLDYPGTLVTNYTYPLDPFQKHAIAAIHKDANVLVTAKTGSGKTLVGEYQIAYSLSKGKRVFYTTPIKSLSNQKFHDLSQMFPSVGIMTGDIKFKPDAQVIVMTTEILRNLLFKAGTKTEHLGLSSSLTLENLGAVVFDEVHYINDKSRGKVWEETFILLPPTVQLVLLSATIERPDLFAAWLGSLKKVPIYLIPTTYRVVPLTHYIIQKDELVTIMDSKENFDAAPYRAWLQGIEASKKAHKDFKDRVAAKNAEGITGGLEKPGGQQHSFVHRLNETINFLAKKELLPALFFVFSRKDCEAFAKKIQGSLIDSSDAAATGHLINFHFLKTKESIEKLPSFWALRDLLVRGIAYHHSGMLPALKEIVELLFTKGHIKVLFATETFAVGINMPTKTVVFTAYEKFCGDHGGKRMLNTDEYTQMAGRAGRRGKDKMGVVIYLPSGKAAEVGEVKEMMKGHRAQVESRMDFHYDFILKTAFAENQDWLALMKDSYWWKQRDLIIEQLDLEYNTLKSLIVDVNPDVLQREILENQIATAKNAKRRDAQRALEAWKNTHAGPKWIKEWDILLGQIKILKEIEILEETIRRSKSVATDTVEPAFRFLVKAGFLDEERKLTDKGVLATEINEGHALIFAELFQRGTCSKLTQEEQIGFFGAFMESENDPPAFNDLKIGQSLRNVFYEAADLAQIFINKEDSVRMLSPPQYYKLHTSWIEPLMAWTRGESIESICTTYGCYEGNLIRAILKASNMLEEWRALATFTSNVAELQRLEHTVLIRDIAVPDSIYLRL